MALPWPTLRRLDLAPEPNEAVQGTAGNSLSILNGFAEKFNDRVESLGLFFKVARDDLITKRGFYMFTSLRTLVVGVSQIPQADLSIAALFLGGITNPVVTIKAGRRSWSSPFMSPTSQEVANVAVWASVNRSVQDVHCFQRALRFGTETRMETAKSWCTVPTEVLITEEVPTSTYATAALDEGALRTSSLA